MKLDPDFRYNATCQVTNQNASKQSACVTKVITRGMKRRTITWTAGGIFLIWQQPISARDFRSALILTGCRDARLRSVDAGIMIYIILASTVRENRDNSCCAFRYERNRQKRFPSPPDINSYEYEHEVAHGCFWKSNIWFVDFMSTAHTLKFESCPY
jgi:hypothetical protein